MALTRPLVCLLIVCAISSRAFAEEDPAVTRARELARQQYELDKARRQADEAKKKLAEEEALRKAIALTRQGVVSLYNTGNSTAGHINFSARWKMWDGTYTDWAQTKIDDRKSLYFTKLGGIKFEVKFASIGGEKTFLVETSQLPNDVKPAFDDGKPYHFAWGKSNDLNFFTGKPAKW